MYRHIRRESTGSEMGATLGGSEITSEESEPHPREEKSNSLFHRICCCYAGGSFQGRNISKRESADLAAQHAIPLLITPQQEDPQIEEALNEWKSLYRISDDHVILDIKNCFYLKKKTLKIGDKGLDSIPSSVIEKCSHIKHLKLYGNRLSSLPLNGSVFTGLEEIDLSANILQCLPTSLPSFRKVTILDLSQNCLKAAPDSLSSLKELKSLNVLRLRGNGLEKLPLSLTECQHLEHLDVGKNRLNHDLSVIQQMTHLKSLKLDGNWLNDNLLEPLFHSNQWKKLEELDLSHNQLKKIPDEWITNLPRLKSLNLSYNDLGKGGLFEGEGPIWDSLTHLDLSFNRLTHLPEDLGERLPSLTHLNLSMNQLSSLPHSLIQCSHLQEVSIEINSIDLGLLEEIRQDFVRTLRRVPHGLL